MVTFYSIHGTLRPSGLRAECSDAEASKRRTSFASVPRDNALDGGGWSKTLAGINRLRTSSLGSKATTYDRRRSRCFASSARCTRTDEYLDNYTRLWCTAIRRCVIRSRRLPVVCTCFLISQREHQKAPTSAASHEGDLLFMSKITTSGQQYVFKSEC